LPGQRHDITSTSIEQRRLRNLGAGQREDQTKDAGLTGSDRPPRHAYARSVGGDEIALNRQHKVRPTYGYGPPTVVRHPDGGLQARESGAWTREQLGGDDGDGSFVQRAIGRNPGSSEALTD
jgi:hypothetical protein